MSPRTTFENELKQLKENVTEMAKRVEENYESLFQAFENQRKEEIIRIKHIDKEIGKRQREIESRCLFLITKQQPVIGDLRVVTASLKAVTDIERAGDHVSDMAELILRLEMKDVNQYTVHLWPMIRAAREMLHMAVKAFTDRNIQAARDVIKGDDAVDDLFNKVKEDLIDALKKELKDADDCVDILMLAKYLEKIGDHAVNIGEWEIFQETGNISDIRLL